MTVRTRAWLSLPLCACLLAIASPARAQSGDDDPFGDAIPDSVLGYEREYFDYPTATRRNPFRPLTASYNPTPRFEDLEVSGIVYGPDVGSVAVVVDRTTERRYRLREGELIGPARVLEIRPDEVAFLLTTFGVTRQASLPVKKPQEQEE